MVGEVGEQPAIRVMFSFVSVYTRSQLRHLAYAYGSSSCVVRCRGIVRGFVRVQKHRRAMTDTLFGCGGSFCRRSANFLVDFARVASTILMGLERRTLSKVFKHVLLYGSTVFRG